MPAISVDASELDAHGAVRGAGHEDLAGEAKFVAVPQQGLPVEFGAQQGHAGQLPARLAMLQGQLGIVHEQPFQNQLAAPQGFQPIQFRQHLPGPARRHFQPTDADHGVQSLPAARQAG